MATESELKAISNSQLASSAEIPAVKHRTVNNAIIEEMFDGQSRGDVLAAVQSALSLSAGDKVLVIRSGQAYLLDANSFGLVSNLVDLSDVQITSPVNGQALVYDAGLSKYVLKDIFLDVSWQDPIISFLNFTTSEPSSPTTGDRYVNTVTGNGSVSTGETFTINYIYEWNGVDWTETVPLQGYTLVNNGDGKLYNFNGTSWVAASSGALPTNVALTDSINDFTVEQSIKGYLLWKAGDGFGSAVFTPASTIGSDNPNILESFNTTSLGFKTQGVERIRITTAGLVGIGTSTPSEKLEVVGSIKATNFIGTGEFLTGFVGIRRVTLGTNATALDAGNYPKVIGTATYTASTTLTFSNVSFLQEIALQITNTNANVLTFAGLTLYFKSSDLPSGVSFASNAITFPADSAVKYNLVGVLFDSGSLDCKIEIR